MQDAATLVLLNNLVLEAQFTVRTRRAVVIPKQTQTLSNSCARLAVLSVVFCLELEPVVKICHHFSEWS